MTPPAFDAAALVGLRRVGAVAAAPDGTWLAVEVGRLDADGAKYVTDLWRVPTSGGAPTQLTRGDESDRAPAFDANGDLLFVSKRPRDAKDDKPRPQVWRLPATGGEARPVTDEPLGVVDFRCRGGRLVVQAEVWPGVPFDEQRAHDQRRVDQGPSALHYKTMTVRYWDHWLPMTGLHFVAWDGEARRDLTPEAGREHREAGWDLSSDGRRVATTRWRPGSDRIDDGALVVIDVDTGAQRAWPCPDKTTFEHPLWAPDSRRVVTVRHDRTDVGMGPMRLWLHDADAPGEGSSPAAEWDATPTPQAWVGDDLLVTTDRGGRVPLYRLSPGRAPERLTEDGCHGGVVALADGSVAGVCHSMLRPPEVFRLADGALTRLSDFSGFDGAALVTWSELEVTSADGTPVRSFVVEPKGADGPRPLLLWIHGGPVGQFADGWHWRWCPLLPALAGYTVVMPNPRGSTGVDQAFIDGVWDNRWGAECYQDLMAVTDAMAARPDIDETRMVAMGGSFGGYMTNWIGGHTERFKALVTHASIYQLDSFHGTTDVPAWLYTENRSHPHDDPEAFNRYSPHRFVKAWRTPTLVIHGEKDYRVPISEALLLFEALQREGVPSELLVFPDENHWVLRPKNIVSWYETWMEFVDRHL